MDSAASQWPAVKLGADSAYYLRNGQPVLVPRAPTAGWVRLYAEDASFLGIGHIIEDGRVAPKRLVASRARPTLVGGR
jgi:tRNA pseudouridine55 synthase